MTNNSRDFLDVEDDEQRQDRIGGLLARLNNPSSSTLVASHPVSNIGHGIPPGPIEPPTELLARVKAFLPAISASNAALSQVTPEDIDIENVQEDEEQYIQMDLGLGVFEAKSHTESGPGPRGPSSEADSSPGASSSEPESESESSRLSSEEDSESDSSSSFDDDSDSESLSGSSIDMRPVFPRPIKPLPRRVSGKTREV